MDKFSVISLQYSDLIDKDTALALISLDSFKKSFKTFQKKTHSLNFIFFV